METQCNWLKANNKFSPEALKFFTDNGYIDTYGSFAFSERFTGILSGTSIDGNFITSAWDCARKYGLLPRADFDYSETQANKFHNQADMCRDYYDPSHILPSMKDKALKSLQYLQVQYEWASAVSADLKQSPLQIGVPVCQDNWNNSVVQFCPSTVPAHCILLYAQCPQGYNIRDQYNPMNKILVTNYYLPQILMGVLSPIVPPTPEELVIMSQKVSILSKIVSILLAIFNKKN
jgi:hypothetical protein